MKRFVSCLLAVIMVCSLLAGCAAPGKDSTAGETAAAAGIFYENSPAFPKIRLS